MAEQRMRYVMEAQLNIAQVKHAVGEIQNSLAGISLPKEVGTSFTKNLEKINQEIGNFEHRLSRGLKDSGDFKELTKSGSQILKIYKELQISAARLGNLGDKELRKLFPIEISENITKATQALKEYNAASSKMISDTKKNGKEIANERKNLRELIEKRSQLMKTTTAESSDKAMATSEANKAKAAWKSATDIITNYEKIQNKISENAKQHEVEISNQRKKIAELEAVRAKFYREQQEELSGKRAKAITPALKAKREWEKAAESLEKYQDQLDKIHEDKKPYGKTKKGTPLKQPRRDPEYKTLDDQEKAIQKKIDFINQLEQKYKKLAEVAKSIKTDSSITESKQFKGYTTQINEALKALHKMKTEGRDAFKIDATKALANFQKATREIQSLTESYNKLNTKANDIGKLDSAEGKASKLAEINSKIQETVQHLKTLQNESKQNFGKAHSENLNKLYETLSKIPGLDLTGFKNNVNGATAAVEQLGRNALNQVRTGLQGASSAVKQSAMAFDQLAISNRRAAEAEKQFAQQARDIDGLRSRISYFFGISNAINMFRRAVHSAFSTVKELDAAMTETAVVTDFSVGDMWKELPRYTEEANKLGTTTLGAYNTMTLFYQQGLKTNEVFEIGSETMKMARIAGMDYTEATNMMTAALRGFNMELNETSAQRVNDVYSELAAITASDTQEISTAMTKTASIAHNANMEFESTAAFLSQIIETTRESAETAGTAMKTVIARFQELKKDPEEIGMVDGEAINANEIEGALRTIGVALRDARGQFRDLDDVFIEIASKWDSLDTNHQRYIATIAAGSRQQSRFIAMMSDYERTMQLIEAANNSAGASQRQFEKTTESLESKLNNLTNAWNAFTMGLANSTVIKTGVDLLTGLINGVNKLTDSLGPTVGAIAKVGLALGSLKAGSKLFNAFFAQLKANKDIVSAFFGAFKSVGKDSAKSFMKLFQKTDTSGVTQAAEKMEDYRNKAKEVAEQEAHLAEVRAGTARSMVGEAALTTELTKAKGMQAAAMTELAGVYGLTEAQQATANSLLSQGIPLEIALAQAKGLVTAEELKNMATEQANLLVKDQNRKATAEEILMQQQLIASKLLEESVTKKSVATKIAQWTASKLQAVANLKLAGSSIIAAKAQELHNLAMTHGIKAMLISLGIIAAVVAVVALLTAGVIALFKAYQNAKPENQLKKAEEAASAAADAASKAEENFQNLVDTLSELSDSYGGLNELTKGTEEWKEAVRHTNDEVLDLIRNYSELAPFVKMEGGILTIDVDSQEVKDVIADYDQRKSLAKVAKIASDIEVKDKEKDVDFSKLNNNAKVTQKKFIAESNTWSSIISQSLTNELAGLLTSGQIRQDENGSYQKEIKEWLIENKVITGADGEADVNEITIQAARLSNQADSLIDYGRQLRETELSKATQLNAMVSEAITMGLGASVSDQRVANLDEQFLQDSLEKSIKNLDTSSWYNNKGKLKEDKKEEYATNLGYEYLGDNKFKDGDTEITIDDSKIIAQLEKMEGTSDLSIQLQDFSKVFDNMEKDDADNLSALFSTDGQDIDRILFDKIAGLSNGGAVDANQIAEFLGFQTDDESSAIMKLAESFGMTVEEAASLISENLASANDDITYRRKRLVQAMKKTNKYIDKQYTQIANELKSLDEKFQDIDFEFELDIAVNSLESSNDEELVNKGTEEFIEIANMPEVDGDELRELSSFIANIDWSNPIDAVYALNQEVTEGTGYVQQYAASIEEVTKQALGAGDQMQYLLEPDRFKPIQDELDDILEKNGKIAGSDVKGLAKSYKSLDKIMKNTDLTAENLAKAFNMIANGDLSMHQMTDAVMATLESVDSLDGAITDVLETLAEFDPGKDENDVAEFMDTAFETVNGNLSKGATGNSQNFAFLDLLYGPQWRQTMDEEGNIIDLQGEALTKAMEQRVAHMQQNTTSMRASWANLADKKDAYGEDINKDALGSLTIERSTTTDFGIEFNGFEGMTSQDIIENLSKAYKVSKTYAGMMLADFKNYSSDLAYELAKNDYTSGIEKAFEKLHTISIKNGENSFLIKPVIDTSEIEAMSTILGRSYDEVKAEFTERGAIITDFYDEGGILKETSEIINQLNELAAPIGDKGKEAGKVWAENFASETKDGKTLIDYDGMMDALKDLNIPEETRAKIANSILTALEEGKKAADPSYEAEVSFTVSDGSTKTVEITPELNIESAITQAENELRDGQLAEAIASAFGDVSINPTIEGENLTVITEQISGAIQDSNQEINPKPTTESLAQITKQTSKAIEKSNQNVKPKATKSSLKKITRDINTAVDNSDTTVDVDADTSAALRKIKKLAKEKITVTVDVKTEEYAKGIKNSPKEHTALIAEEGPELVQTKDGAYLAEDPQLALIHKGDTVYTANQTKKILDDNKPLVFQRHALGYGDSHFNPDPEDPDSPAPPPPPPPDPEIKEPETIEAWMNVYDWLYNITAAINTNLHKREMLEKRFQLLQKQGRVDARGTLQYYQDYIKLLRQEYELQRATKDKKGYELTKFLGDNAGMQRYATFNQTTGQIEINYDAINAVKDPEEGERIETFIGRLEEIVGAIHDAEKTMLDIEINTEDIKDELGEAYTQLEERVAAALEAIDQKKIDDLTEVYDAMNAASSDLMEAINHNITESRTDRENEKTEESIAEKQRKLAYLQQDTSGAHDLEIMALEKDIEAEQEAYQDQLVDQALNNLQMQNDAAALQREKEIELMESQLAFNVENGVYNKQVASLLEAAYSNDNFLTADDDLYNILYDGEGWNAKTVHSLGQILEEVNNLASTAFAGSHLNDGSGGEGNHSGIGSSDNRDIMQEMIEIYQSAGGVVTPELVKKNEERNQKIWDNPDEYSHYGAIDDAALGAYMQEHYGNVDFMKQMAEEFVNAGYYVTENIYDLNRKRNAKIAAHPELAEMGYTQIADANLADYMYQYYGWEHNAGNMAPGNPNTSLSPGTIIKQSLDTLEVQNSDAADQRTEQNALLTGMSINDIKTGQYNEQIGNILAAVYGKDKLLAYDEDLYNAVYTDAGWNEQAVNSLIEIFKILQTIDSTIQVPSIETPSTETPSTETPSTETPPVSFLPSQVPSRFVPSTFLPSFTPQTTSPTGNKYPQKGERVQVKESATHFGSKNNYVKMADQVPGGFYEVQQVDQVLNEILIGLNGIATGWVNLHDLVGYKTGGLANFTGPAWLDGTKSRPEIVLNATDSANFMELRDILRDSQSHAAIQKEGGDTYHFDIDVNDPRLDSDYDVDELVNRVETDIYEKASYRNINSLSRLK